LVVEILRTLETLLTATGDVDIEFVEDMEGSSGELIAQDLGKGGGEKRNECNSAATPLMRLFPGPGELNSWKCSTYESSRLSER
jgi:hypothetical protein